MPAKRYIVTLTADQRVVAQVPSLAISMLALHDPWSDQRAVHVEGGPVEERSGLLGPDLAPRHVDVIKLQFSGFLKYEVCKSEIPRELRVAYRRCSRRG
jgi:hypothetical protein